MSQQVVLLVTSPNMRLAHVDKCITQSLEDIKQIYKDVMPFYSNTVNLFSTTVTSTMPKMPELLKHKQIRTLIYKYMHHRKDRPYTVSPFAPPPRTLP
jgi:hypothetical protein